MKKVHTIKIPKPPKGFVIEDRIPEFFEVCRELRINGRWSDQFFREIAQRSDFFKGGVYCFRKEKP